MFKTTVYFLVSTSWVGFLFKLTTFLIPINSDYSNSRNIWFYTISTREVKFKLMRLGSANRIDDFESKSRSEFDRRIIVDSDSNDLIKSSITIFDIKSIYFRLNRYKIDLFRYIFDLLINLNQYNVDYLIKIGQIISKIGRIWIKNVQNRQIFLKFDQIRANSTIFGQNSTLDSNLDRDLESDSSRRVIGPLESNQKRWLKRDSNPIKVDLSIWFD